MRCTETELMEDNIQVTCQTCNHVVKAPRAAGGKWGKCPFCHNRVYVPTPPDELEDIPLAPIDQDAEEQAEKLKQEELRIDSAIWHEPSEPDKPDKPAPPQNRPSAGIPPQPASSAINITDTIVAYLQALQSSNLEKAEQLAAQLSAHKNNATDRIQQLMVDPVPPAPVRDMPPGLFQGLLRKLLEQIDSA